jgi:hypothetical protein
MGDTQPIDDYNRVSRTVSSLAAAVNGTYTYNSNSLFCAFANPGYRDYLYRYVYREAAWLDGFVYDFHNPRSGIISSRICPSILLGLARQIKGTSLSFKSSGAPDPKALDWISHRWSPKSNIDQTAQSAILYMLALGTSLVKINKTSSGLLWLEAVRFDQCYFESDFAGEVTEATFFIRRYVDTKDPDNNFFVVERRWLEDVNKEITYTLNGKIYKKTARCKDAMVSFQIHKFVGVSLNGTMPSASNARKGLNWTEIPQWLKDNLKKDYSALRFNEPQKLPFHEWIGVEALRNDGQDPTVPTLGVGSSLILAIQPELIAYDFAFSKYLEAMYQGSGKVGIPKSLSMPTNTEAGQALSDSYQGLDFSKYETVEGLDPTKQQPIVTQFALRAEEWHSILDNLLRKIATKIGMSPKVIASYLSVSNSQKTATEIDSEDDATIAYIESVRQNVAPAFNRMIEEVLNQNGMSANVEIKFGSPSLVSKDKIIDRVIKLKDSGLINLKEAIREVFPDEDETQIEIRLAEAEENQPIFPDVGGTYGQAPSPSQEAKANLLPPTDEDGVIIGGEGHAD